jgi:thioesterase domain-containing protein
MGADQPIYGVQCEGLNGLPRQQDSMVDLARTYVTRIRAVYPRGPYTFYGASLGGVIAMEMARQLLEDGEEVPLVALGDTLAPSAIVIPPSRRERVSRRATELRASPVPVRVWHALASAGRVLARRAERLSPASREVRRIDRATASALRRGTAIPVEARESYIMRQYGTLMVGHSPGPPFPDRVLLLRATTPNKLSDRGWGPLLDGSLEVVDVACGHADLGREASGPLVGPILTGALNQQQLATA